MAVPRPRPSCDALEIVALTSNGPQAPAPVIDERERGAIETSTGEGLGSVVT